MLEPEGRPIGRPGEPVDPAPSSPVDEAQVATDDWAAWWSAHAAGLPPPPRATTPGPPQTAPPGLPPPAAPPEAPAWTKTYELPTARKVVGAGLTLAAISSGPIRRASLYVGLLALGAFGPAIVLLLVAIGRLMTDPATAATMAIDPSLILFEQPEIVGTLLLIYFLAIVGLILLVAISIDAQAIAIALLGGIAAEQPLRLWEAVVRARQTFWRLFVAGLLVGVTSAVVNFVVVIPFVRPFDSNTGLTFAGSMLGTLVVTPFAFAATGIVLGDVGAIEALRRSVGLFRARPAIAFVVVLFTLVTSAIQTFALNAGLDVTVRVADFLDIGLDQGGLGLILPLVLVLGFVMAFGSLTFTIAAIVAAPQVAAFLGLTFYSAGLDRARSGGAPRPRRLRWVSVPMTLTIVGVLVIAGLGLPRVISFQPRPESPIMAILRTAPGLAGRTVVSNGASNEVADPAGDGIGLRRDSIDVISAGYALLPEVPDWFLSALFDCGASNVACGDRGGTASFSSGAYLFHQRMAGAPGVLDDTERGQWGPLVVLDRRRAEPFYADEPLSGATHVILTRMELDKASIHLFAASDTYFDDLPTNARSTWIGNDLLTLVPAAIDLPTELLRWDVTASIGFARGGHDALRPTSMTPLRVADSAPLEIFLLDAFGDGSFVP